MLASISLSMNQLPSTMQFRGPTVVHEVGLVATKCGWVQAVEACGATVSAEMRPWLTSTLRSFKNASTAQAQSVRI